MNNGSSDLIWYIFPSIGLPKGKCKENENSMHILALTKNLTFHDDMLTLHHLSLFQYI